MYLTGADVTTAAARCSRSTCQFQYAPQWTPTTQYFVSLGGSGGNVRHPYRAYGTIYGATADFTSNSNYAITQGGYGCATDPDLQYYGGGGSSIVDWSGTGIVKWCAKGGGGGGNLNVLCNDAAPVAVACRLFSPPVASTSRFALMTQAMDTGRPFRLATHGRCGACVDEMATPRN